MEPLAGRVLSRIPTLQAPLPQRSFHPEQRSSGRPPSHRTNGRCICRPGRACMHEMYGRAVQAPSDHTKRQNSPREKKEQNGGANGSGRCGIALGAETEDGRSSSSSSNKARRPLNLHSPSAPGPARPSPADGSVPGAACRASSRPRRRPFRLRHGGTAPRSCWGVQSFRGVSSAGPWRRPWCAIHGPGSDRCSPCPPPPSPA